MEKNNIDQETNHIKEGFLPLLITVNLNSKLSPIRPVLVPNQNAIPIQNLSISEGTALGTPSEDLKQNLKPISYNDTIQDYSLALPSQTETTINHLLTMSPIYSDVSDGFKQSLSSIPYEKYHR